MLNLSDKDLKILESTKLTANSDPSLVVKEVLDKYHKLQKYRDGFFFLKRNPCFVDIIDLLSYMLLFNEYNLSLLDSYKGRKAQFTSLIFEIIKYKCSINKNEGETIQVKNRNIESVDLNEQSTSFSLEYEKLKNAVTTKEDLLQKIYSLFIGDQYEYNRLLEYIKTNERLDIVKLVLSKYDIEDFKILYNEIVAERTKEKFDTINYVLTNDLSNTKYLCELSEYFIEDNAFLF